MKRRALLLGGLLLLFAWPVRGDKPAENKPVTVPIEVLKTKHLAIQVKINGKGPYRMIFDTGAPITLVSSKVAKEAGMIPKDAKVPPIALFGAMGQFPIQSLEVGTLKAEKVPAMVMDHPAVTALGRALGPLEGIIGFPFFARYSMTLDYQAQQVTLVPNGYVPADILETLTATILNNQKPPPVVLAPAAQWGLVLNKPEKDEEAGVAIEQVRPGSAADAAGIKAGDRLLAIDGWWTESLADGYRATMGIKPGTAVPVTLRRAGKEMTVTVKPRAGL
jgi:membrane-associated protease RseP (regulator of RpoE activity)